MRHRFGVVGSLLVASVLLVGVAGPAAADSISTKQAEARRVANKIQQMQEYAESLSEAYNKAVDDLAKATASVDGAKAALATQDERVGGLKTKLSQFALRTYVLGGELQAPAGAIADSTGAGLVARNTYAALFLGTNVDAADQLAAVRQDLDRTRATLTAQLNKQAQLTAAVNTKSTSVLKAIDDAQSYEANLQGDLAKLVAAERQRQEQEAIRQSQARAAAALAAQARAAAAAIAAQAGYPGRIATAPAGTGARVPPPSPGAAGAVASARSQLGVPYVFAAARPGVAFDCSGLTMWAWGRSGVRMPHFAASQYAMFPHVPVDQAQPGDLVFFYSDIHHVGIYIGAGLMINAPHTGDVVRIAPAFGAQLVGVARPG